MGDSVYNLEMVTYAITKDGLMYEEIVGGQKFSCTEK